MGVLKILMFAGFACGLLGAWAPVTHAQVNPATLPSTVRGYEPPQRVEMRSPQLEISAPQPTGLAEPPANAEAVGFVLQGVVVEGMTVYAPAQFDALYAGRVGKEVSLAEVYRWAAWMTERYRQDGYFLSEVIVPTTDAVVNGQVRLVAVEGYISHVDFDFGPEAKRPGGTSQFAAFSKAMLSARPLRSGDLERGLLLLNGLPGMNAHALVQPTPEPGAAALQVVVDYKGYDGEVAFDNRGSGYIGPGQMYARLGLNNPFGDEGRLEVRAAASHDLKEQTFGEIGYSRRLNDQGLNMRVLASTTRSEPGRELRAFGLKQRTDRFEGTLSYPLVLQDNELLAVAGTFSYLNDAFDAVGTEFYDDKVRALRLGALWNKTDGWLGNNSAQVELSRGLAVLGASKKGDLLISNPHAEPNFTKVTATVSREQMIRDTPLSVYGSVTGQHADGPLYATEQFSVGGANYLSGFDPSAALGDSGVAARIEPRFNQTLENSKYVEGLQYYTFYDHGVVYLRKPFEGQPGRRSLASAGAGVRVFATHGIRLSLEASKPVQGAVGAQQDRGLRLFFGISKAF